MAEFEQGSLGPIFDAARRGIVEGTSSPYSGINPVLRARLQQLGLQ